MYRIYDAEQGYWWLSHDLYDAYAEFGIEDCWKDWTLSDKQEAK